MAQPGNTLRLRPARLEELDALSDLCLRSKAVWGYDAAFIAACRAELTLGPADLSGTKIEIAECGGQVMGVAQISVAGAIAQLEKLFVEPSTLGRGIGRALFAWARDTANADGAQVLVIEADPGAAEFYRRMGANDDGRAPSGSIPGRMLPRLKMQLT